MDDIILVAETLFNGVWNILVATKFPGTEFSLAAITIAIMIACFAIRIFSYLTGFHAGGSTYGQAADAMEKGKSAYLHLKPKNKIGF